MARAKRKIAKKRDTSKNESGLSAKRIETLELQVAKLEEQIFALDEVVKVTIPKKIFSSMTFDSIAEDDSRGDLGIWTGPVLTASATAQYVSGNAWWAVPVNLSDTDFWGNDTPIANATVTSRLTLAVAGARISANANGTGSVAAGANLGITTDAFGDAFVYINSGTLGVCTVRFSYPGASSKTTSITFT